MQDEYWHLVKKSKWYAEYPCLLNAKGKSLLTNYANAAGSSFHWDDMLPELVDFHLSQVYGQGVAKYGSPLCDGMSTAADEPEKKKKKKKKEEDVVPAVVPADDTAPARKSSGLLDKLRENMRPLIAAAVVFYFLRSN